MPRSYRGEHLTPQEKFEEEQEAEKQDRLARFVSGVRGVPTMPGPTSTMNDYARLHEDPAVSDALLRFQLANQRR